MQGQGSGLLGPGAHKVLFVPSKSLFPSPVFWWLCGGAVNFQMFKLVLEKAEEPEIK